MHSNICRRVGSLEFICVQPGSFREVVVVLRS